MTGAVLATMPFHIWASGDGQRSPAIAPRITGSRIDCHREWTVCRINVLGLLSDGRSINVTRPETGTLYEIADARIAAIDLAGLVSPRAGGTTEVSARNGRSRRATY